MSTEPAGASTAPRTAKPATESGKQKAGRSGTYTTKAARSSLASRGSGEATSKKPRRNGTSVVAGGSTTKISVTVPTDVLAEVRELAPENLSAVVAEALRQWSAHARLGHILDELDTIHGPVPDDLAAEVEAEWGPIFDRSAARRANRTRT